MAGASLDITGLTRRYADGTREQDVLREASLHVKAGELLAVTGPSGSGKSTLLHVAGGLDRAYTGSVKVDGTDLAALDDTALSKFRASTVGFVFQAFNLLPTFSALENVMLPGHFGADTAEGRARAQRALDEVGLGAKSHRKPGELSGGERQRIALARALWSKPRLLLADEPTGNLDAATGAQVIELLVKLNREHGVTLVIVTHEDRVSRIASRVVRLTEGKLVEAVS